jgi:hypothetical protein
MDTGYEVLGFDRSFDLDDARLFGGINAACVGLEYNFNEVGHFILDGPFKRTIFGLALPKEAAAYFLKRADDYLYRIASLTTKALAPKKFSIVVHFQSSPEAAPSGDMHFFTVIDGRRLSSTRAKSLLQKVETDDLLIVRAINKYYASDSTITGRAFASEHHIKVIGANGRVDTFSTPLRHLSDEQLIKENARQMETEDFRLGTLHLGAVASMLSMLVLLVGASHFENSVPWLIGSLAAWAFAFILLFKLIEEVRLNQA